MPDNGKQLWDSGCLWEGRREDGAGAVSVTNF